MEDKKEIKVIFSVHAVSIIADTDDEKEGEASVGYEYKLNTSFPELAFALAGFLKAVEDDHDIKDAMQVAKDRTISEAFISLVQAYYAQANDERQ